MVQGWLSKKLCCSANKYLNQARMPSSEITPGGGKEASPGGVMAMLTKMQQDMEEAAATKDAAHEI